MSGSNRVSVIHKTIIVSESLKDVWIDQPSRAVPPATQVNVRNAALRYANVLNHNGVGWDAIRKWCGLTLENINVFLRAFVISDPV